jgi:hypothetical protein
MTMAQDVERSPGGGGRRGDRSRTPDVLPQPRAVRREVRELVVRAQALALVYSAEHEALLTLGSSEVHVTSAPGSATESAVLDRENEAARRRCARAVSHLRSAATHIDLALRAFGPLADQPERSPDAVVSQSTFDKARREHYEREKRLRVE